MVSLQKGENIDTTNIVIVSFVLVGRAGRNRVLNLSLFYKYETQVVKEVPRFIH